MRTAIALLACSAAMLAACGQEADNTANDVAVDRMEEAAEASAIAAGPAEAALGLSEVQLLDADLRSASGEDLGDVEAVLRNAQGVVDRLVVEIDNTNPDRFVEVPIAGLTTMVRGDDTDLSTTMTREQLLALPDAVLPAATPR